MPAFIRTKEDEARWSKAKAAADKSHSESEGDSYWAVVNSIYQKMKKSDDALDEAKQALEKARKRLSDEYDPNEMGDDSDYSDQEDLGEGYREFNPDDEESAGEDWLRENDPERKDDYEEYGDEEDQDAHQKGIEEDFGNDEEPKVAAQEAPDEEAAQEEKQSGRFRQPTKEDLIGMRAYTRPWEQRARETQRLQADPSKNPVLAHQGNIIEARNTAHGDRKAAYQALTNSDEYKNADPITQMEMDDKFENEWKSKNPEHLKGAMEAHSQAHSEGKKGYESHASAKDAAIRNILTGGAQHPDAYSFEEGMQHAGGVKGEEGTEGSVKHDPAASFAMGNQDFIRQYAKDYENKGKKPSDVDDMMNYDEGSKRDISRILGPAQAKDPKFEQFFSHYYPLIGMSANRTIRKLGLDPRSPDLDMSMLHEAGMHGLIQAINDYDHDNPSKASFATHAGNKIRGLQLTAMRNQDQIPAEMRQAQKKFMSQKAAGVQPKAPTAHSVITSSGHPGATDMADRLKRVGTQRAAQQIKVRKAPTGGTSGNQ